MDLRRSLHPSIRLGLHASAGLALAAFADAPALAGAAKVSKGTPKLPKGTQASVSDQFAEARTFDVKKPTRVCLGVDKNGEGIPRPDDALVCYKAKPAKGQPKHARLTGVHVNHQFGPAQLDTVKEEELCLPSNVSTSN